MLQDQFLPPYEPLRERPVRVLIPRMLGQRDDVGRGMNNRVGRHFFSIADSRPRCPVGVRSRRLTGRGDKGGMCPVPLPPVRFSVWRAAPAYRVLSKGCVGVGRDRGIQRHLRDHRDRIRTRPDGHARTRGPVRAQPDGVLRRHPRAAVRLAGHLRPVGDLLPHPVRRRSHCVRRRRALPRRREAVAAPAPAGADDRRACRLVRQLRQSRHSDRCVRPRRRLVRRAAAAVPDRAVLPPSP